MSVEMLTYAALGARLKISPEAARSLSRRLRLPRSLSDDGKALVSVDLAEIRHTPRPPRDRAGNIALLAAEDRGIEGGDRAARNNGSRSQSRFRARVRARRSPGG